MTALHAPVRAVLAMLGVEGRFTAPGGGNSAIIGDPDFSWVMGHEQLHPKVVVRPLAMIYVNLLSNAIRVFRLSTNLGGWPHWGIFPLPFVALVMTNSPRKLSNKSTV
jgi:hypothetical protein